MTQISLDHFRAKQVYLDVLMRDCVSREWMYLGKTEIENDVESRLLKSEGNIPEEMWGDFLVFLQSYKNSMYLKMASMAMMEVEKNGRGLLEDKLRTYFRSESEKALERLRKVEHRHELLEEFLNDEDPEHDFYMGFILPIEVEYLDLCVNFELYLTYHALDTLSILGEQHIPDIIYEALSLDDKFEEGKQTLIDAGFDLYNLMSDEEVFYTLVNYGMGFEGYLTLRVARTFN